MLESPCGHGLRAGARDGVTPPRSIAGMQKGSVTLQGCGGRPWASRQIARCEVCWQLAKRSEMTAKELGFALSLF